jgi:hypothetical protein
MESNLLRARDATLAARESLLLVGEDHPLKSKLENDVRATEEMVARLLVSLDFWASLKTP